MIPLAAQASLFSIQATARSRNRLQPHDACGKGVRVVKLSPFGIIAACVQPCFPATDAEPAAIPRRFYQVVRIAPASLRDPALFTALAAGKPPT
jgi:hypothetical protein